MLANPRAAWFTFPAMADLTIPNRPALAGALKKAMRQHRVGCLDAADPNDDEEINITDAVYLLEYLYRGGAAPASPFPQRGSDPGEEGALGCEDGLDPFGG